MVPNDTATDNRDHWTASESMLVEWRVSALRLRLVGVKSPLALGAEDRDISWRTLGELTPV
jgi:hypothetical protein